MDEQRSRALGYCKSKEESDKILNEVFEKGYLAPLEYLMQQEKMLSDKVKNELKNDDEAKAYCLALEEENYDLVGVMIAYEFSMLDLLYTADRQQ